MLKAWAQLIRLPNVFTAPADVIAGSAFGFHAIDQSVFFGKIGLFCMISICFYAGGMILNDVADRTEDLRDRPFRPIPSGRISVTHAGIAGFGLLLAGILLSFTQLPDSKSPWDAWPVLILPSLIISYNFHLKHTVLGPLVMGLCRGCNLLLGTLILTEVPYTCYLAAGINVIYITGVTIIASDETRQVKGWKMNSGLVLIFLSQIMLVIEALGRIGRMTHGYVEAMVWMSSGVLMASVVLWFPSVRNPVPANISRSIKYSILGLIMIDTIHATLGFGYPGLWLLVLLIPALFLGRFIYST